MGLPPPVCGQHGESLLGEELRQSLSQHLAIHGVLALLLGDLRSGRRPAARKRGRPESVISPPPSLAATPASSRGWPHGTRLRPDPEPPPFHTYRLPHPHTYALGAGCAGGIFRPSRTVGAGPLPDDGQTKRMDWRHTGRFCCAAFGMDFAGAMFFVALPYLALSFGADSMQLGVLTALRGAAYILACLPASLLSDRLNRKVLIGLSASGVILAFGGVGCSRNLWQLQAMVVFWALAISPFWPSVFAWLGDSHSPEHLGPATGAVNLSWSVGGMLGGAFAGWLFGHVARAPFFCAAIPAALACATMLRSPCTHTRPEKAASGPRPPGLRRELVTAWLGATAVCSLLGLMSGVFPKLGTELGVTAGVFGLFMAGMGLGRSVVFSLGLRWSRRLHGWGLAAATQVVAGAMVASVARASSHLWLALVFASLGVALAVNYFRGLYKSLEHAGSRGLKSGLHEAALLGGILLGSLGGGAAAKQWGLRAPYAPAGIWVLTLVALQAVLLASARAARGQEAGTRAPETRTPPGE